MYGSNSRINNLHLMSGQQAAVPQPASGSRDLTGLLQALASQTAQTQAMLSALLNQPQTAPSYGNYSHQDVLMKALMERMQQQQQQQQHQQHQPPAIEADHRQEFPNKRPRVSAFSSLSSSPGSSSCTSPNLEADCRSTSNSSISCSDDATRQGARGSESSLKRGEQGARCLKRPYEQQSPQAQFPATCSLLSGLTVGQGTTTAAGAASTSTSPTTPSTSAVVVATDASLCPSRTVSDPVGCTASVQAPVSRHGPYELVVTTQPEANHRARYLTEGSRGAVKDRSQLGYPSVQLLGWSQPVDLCVYVGTDSGKARPHGYYQVCRVAGRYGCSEAREVTQDGTRMLVIPVNPNGGTPISLDCIGILKLRNSDVDSSQHQTLQQPKPSGTGSSKRSSKVRLVFRVTLPVQGASGPGVTLQAVTQTIECTQPAGHPEIHRLSSYESPSSGGSELFIIGRNFAKTVRVLFRLQAAGCGTVWEAEAATEAEFNAVNHLICRVPEFEARRRPLSGPVEVLLSVSCGDRVSEPVYFTYHPDSTTERRSERLIYPAHADQPHHQLHQMPSDTFLDANAVATAASATAASGVGHHAGLLEAFLACEGGAPGMVSEHSIGAW